MFIFFLYLLRSGVERAVARVARLGEQTSRLWLKLNTEEDLIKYIAKDRWLYTGQMDHRHCLFVSCFSEFSYFELNFHFWRNTPRSESSLESELLVCLNIKSMGNIFSKEKWCAFRAKFFFVNSNLSRIMNQVTWFTQFENCRWRRVSLLSLNLKFLFFFTVSLHFPVRLDFIVGQTIFFVLHFHYPF